MELSAKDGNLHHLNVDTSVKSTSEPQKPKDDLGHTNGVSNVRDKVMSPPEKNKSKLKPLHFWNMADFSKWLKKHNSHLHTLYNDLFQQQEITGRTLIRINEIKLERIGITNADHRKELMQYILRLRLRHEASDLKDLDQKGIGFELKKATEKMKQQASKDKDSEKKEK